MEKKYSLPHELVADVGGTLFYLKFLPFVNVGVDFSAYVGAVVCALRCSVRLSFLLFFKKDQCFTTFILRRILSRIISKHLEHILLRVLLESTLGHHVVQRTKELETYCIL